MAYHEPSFLEGLAAGLTATAGAPMGALEKHRATGTDRFSQIPAGQFDTFVGKFLITTPFPVTIVFEYGSDRNAPERVFRRVGASEEQQAVYHVAQLPEAVPLTDYHYNMYLYERSDMVRVIRWDTYFMAFPYYPPSGNEYLYPGRPELVRNWLTRTYR